MAPLEQIKLKGYHLDFMLNGYRPGVAKTRYTLRWLISMLPRWALGPFAYSDLYKIGLAQAFIEEDKDPGFTNIDGWLNHSK